MNVQNCISTGFAFNSEYIETDAVILISLSLSLSLSLEYIYVHAYKCLFLTPETSTNRVYPDQYIRVRDISQLINYFLILPIKTIIINTRTLLIVMTSFEFGMVYIFKCYTYRDLSFAFLYVNWKMYDEIVEFVFSIAWCTFDLMIMCRLKQLGLQSLSLSLQQHLRFVPLHPQVKEDICFYNPPGIVKILIRKNCLIRIQFC